MIGTAIVYAIVRGVVGWLTLRSKTILSSYHPSDEEAKRSQHEADQHRGTDQNKRPQRLPIFKQKQTLQIECRVRW